MKELLSSFKKLARKVLFSGLSGLGGFAATSSTREAANATLGSFIHVHLCVHNPESYREVNVGARILVYPPCFYILALSCKLRTEVLPPPDF